MNELYFSPDNFHYDDSRQTASAAFEALLANVNLGAYLTSIQSSFSGDKTYQVLHSVHEIINSGYAQRQRLGDAFIDGGTVALDIVQRYAPRFLKTIGNGSTTYLEQAYDREYRPNTVDDIFSQKRVNFIMSFQKLGEAGFKAYGTPYEPALNRIFSAYKYQDQQRTLKSGFGFVLEFAARAQSEDMIQFQDDVDRYDQLSGKHSQTLADMLAEQAFTMLKDERHNHEN